MPFKEIKNKKIFYNITGSGFPLIMLHDGFYNTISWEPVRNKLAEYFTVIDYDRFGYGKSDLYSGPIVGDLLEIYSAELLDFSKSLNLDEFYLCGHCLGGAIALIFAKKHPQNVKKIVAESVGFYSDLKILMKSDWTFRPFPEIDKKLKKDLIHMNGEEYAVKFWNILRDYKSSYIMSENYNILKQMKKIQCPVFLIYGDRDIYFDIEHAGTAYKKFKNARLWVVPETSHTPHWEKKDDFVNNVVSFLL